MKIVRRGGIDLVVTDIRMPKLDGIEFLRQLKKESHGTRVVMITALSPSDIDVRDLKYQGAYEVLFKPFKAQELREILERAIGL